MSGTGGEAVAALRRWEDLGGTWEVLTRTPTRVTVALCRCDGGEEVDRLTSGDPDLLRFLADRRRSGS